MASLKITQKLIDKWKQNMRIMESFTSEEHEEIRALDIKNFESFTGHWVPVGLGNLCTESYAYRLRPDYEIEEPKIVSYEILLGPVGVYHFVCNRVDSALHCAVSFPGYLGVEYKEKPGVVYPSLPTDSISLAALEGALPLTPVRVWFNRKAMK